MPIMNPRKILTVAKITREGKYVLKSKLGENSLATVWRAEHRLTGEEVVVKQVYRSKLNKHLISCLECELNFLSSVNHPNIIRLLDVFQVAFDFLAQLRRKRFSFYLRRIQNHWCRRV